MIVSLHHLAEAELVEGTAFYAQEGGRTLAEPFVAEFSRSAALLNERPELGARWRGDLRGLPLRRFLYSIVYHPGVGVLHIVALAHYSRRPGYWRRRV
jgi:hypothetical protein